MVKYVFTIRLEESGDECRQDIDLNTHQENCPELYFTLDKQEEIRQELQQSSSCRINDANLNRIVRTWMQDIKEGYRNTYLNLDLPTLGESKIEMIVERGNREIPALIEPNFDGIEPQFGALPPLDFV